MNVFKIQNIEKSFKRKNQIGLRTVTTFNLGIIQMDLYLGKN